MLFSADVLSFLFVGICFNFPFAFACYVSKHTALGFAFLLLLLPVLKISSIRVVTKIYTFAGVWSLDCAVVRIADGVDECVGVQCKIHM